MKQVAEIDSCISAVRRSMMAKPIRKLVVGLRKILSGSTRKVTRSKLLATIFMGETMMKKMDEPETCLLKTSQPQHASSFLVS